MKLRIHAATASVLIAAGTATVQPASAEAVHPVMVLQHNPAVGDKFWRTTQSCVGTRAGWPVRESDAVLQPRDPLRGAWFSGRIGRRVVRRGCGSNQPRRGQLDARSRRACSRRHGGRSRAIAGRELRTKEPGGDGHGTAGHDAGRRHRGLTFNRAGRGGFVCRIPPSADPLRPLIRNEIDPEGTLTRLARKEAHARAGAY